MNRIAIVVLLLAAPLVAEEPLFEGKPATHWIETLSRGDLGARQRAAWALWKLGPAAGAGAVPLARALEDEDEYVRTTSGKALVKLGQGARPAVPALAALLASKREEVRREAAYALFRMGALVEGHVAEIAKALESEDPVVRANVAGCLVGAGAGAKPAAAALEARLGDEDAKVVTWAARALAAIDPIGSFGHDHRKVRLAAMAPHMNGIRTGGEPVFASIVATLADEDEEVRSVAANAVGNAVLFAQPDQGFIVEAKPRLVEIFARAMAKDPSATMREWAAYALGKIGGHAGGELQKAVLPALLRAAEREEAAVRCAAFQGFRSLGGKVPEAVPVVLQGAGDPDAQIRAVAILTLGSVATATKPVLKALAAALEDWDPAGRTYAAMGLGGFGPEAAPAAGALIACLSAHDDRRTRSAVTLALAEIGAGAKAALPLLEEIFAEGEEVSSEVAYALCRLVTPPPPKAIERLIEVAVSDAAGRALAYLGRLGPAALPAVPALVRVLEEGEANQLPGVADTLGEIGPVAKGALPALEKAAKEGDEALRETAREAIRKIRGE